MQWLKLKDSQDKPIWVNFEQVVSLQQEKQNYTTLMTTWVGQTGLPLRFDVKEDPEEILRQLQSLTRGW